MKIVLDDSWALWHFAFVRNKNRDNKRNDKSKDNEMKTVKTLASKIAKKTVKPKAPISLADLTEAKEALEEIHRKQADLREKELATREYLADLLHDGEEGTKTVTIEGIKVSVTRTLNRTITREEAERLSQEHGEISALALRWKPEVRAGEYRKHAEIMDEYITTKPGPSTVEFK